MGFCCTGGADVQYKHTATDRGPERPWGGAPAPANTPRSRALAKPAEDTGWRPPPVSLGLQRTGAGLHRAAREQSRHVAPALRGTSKAPPSRSAPAGVDGIDLVSEVSGILF